MSKLTVPLQRRRGRRFRVASVPAVRRNYATDEPTREQSGICRRFFLECNGFLALSIIDVHVLNYRCTGKSNKRAQTL